MRDCMLPNQITRRSWLRTAGTAGPLLCAGPALTAWENQLLRNFGGAPAGFPVRFRVAREGGKPFDFVEHCHDLGMGVVEMRPETLDANTAATLRKKVDGYGMRLILDIRLPRNANELSTYEATLRNAKEAGAISMRTAMTQRRYEQWHTLAEFQSAFEQSQKTIELVEPILRKHRLRLGIENHKGWRSAEHAAWMNRLGSEWVGVHFDFGNNMSLCETPPETLKNLRPFVFACHIKDMAVAPYEDGFLLAEVPLGQGLLDLKGMVESLRAKDPAMPFDLEMITRDPLKIPVFTKEYWATFDDAVSPLPGRDVAGVWEMVRKNKPKSPLPKTTGMNVDAALKLEDANVAKSIDYTRRNLRLG